MTNNQYKKQPLLYIHQPNTEVKPAHMQRDYQTPKTKPVTEVPPKEKVTANRTQMKRQFYSATTGTTNTDQFEVEEKLEEEKPFKEMTIKEKIDYFVSRAERSPVIKCEVKTENDKYRGVIKDLKESTVFIKLDKRAHLREIAIDNITEIHMVGF